MCKLKSVAAFKTGSFFSDTSMLALPELWCYSMLSCKENVSKMLQRDADRCNDGQMVLKMKRRIEIWKTTNIRCMISVYTALSCSQFDQYID